MRAINIMRFREISCGDLAVFADGPDRSHGPKIRTGLKFLTGPPEYRLPPKLFPRSLFPYGSAAFLAVSIY